MKAERYAAFIAGKFAVSVMYTRDCATSLSVMPACLRIARALPMM